MSWDVMVQKFAEHYATIDDIRDDAVLLPLGSPTDVRAAINKVFAKTKWTDPSWGTWDDDQIGSIEFSVGEGDSVSGLMLFVRATQAVVPAILLLCSDNGWRGIDIAEGEFLDVQPDPTGGLGSWRSYSEKVLNLVRGRRSKSSRA